MPVLKLRRSNLGVCYFITLVFYITNNCLCKQCLRVFQLSTTILFFPMSSAEVDLRKYGSATDA